MTIRRVAVVLAAQLAGACAARSASWRSSLDEPLRFAERESA